MLFGRGGAVEGRDIFITLSGRFVAIAYDDGSDFVVKSRWLSINLEEESVMALWLKSVKEILKSIDFEPHLYILIDSPLFMVRSIKDGIDSYGYISKQIDTPKGEFEIRKILGESHLVVKNRDIERILFLFRDYSIGGVYDISVLSGLYLLKGSRELYINISLSGVSGIYINRVLQKRYLNYIFSQYIRDGCRSLNLDFDSLFDHLKGGFKGIETYDALLKSTQSGARELLNFIDNIVEFIHSTLQYFKNYDRLEQIDRVYIAGDILELSGVVKILIDRLDFVDATPISDILKIADHRAVSNILAYRADRDILSRATVPLDGLRCSDGKHQYIFVDNSLHIQNRLTKEQRRRVSKSNRATLSRASKVVGSPSKGGGESGFKKLLSRGDKSDLDEEKGKIALLIILIFFAISYYLWLYISDLERDFNRRVDRCRGVIISLDRARERLNSGERVPDMDSGVDKILWTEKLTTMVNAMPEEIWLTSIRLSSQERSVDGKIVTVDRVVLDGRSLPSSAGHINTIASYMDRLMEQGGRFKRDFIGVTFGGAESIFDNSNQHLIGFQLYCNFKRGVNGGE